MIKVYIGERNMEQLVGKNKDILLNGTNMDIIDFIGAIEKMLLKYE